MIKQTSIKKELENFNGQFSIGELKTLILLYNLDEKKEYSIKKLSEEIGISLYNPYFQKIIKYSSQNSILNVIKQYGVMKMYKINKREIEKLLDKQESLKIFFNFFKQRHVVFETD